MTQSASASPVSMPGSILTTICVTAALPDMIARVEETGRGGWKGESAIGSALSTSVSEEVTGCRGVTRVQAGENNDMTDQV